MAIVKNIKIIPGCKNYCYKGKAGYLIQNTATVSNILKEYKKRDDITQKRSIDKYVDATNEIFDNNNYSIDKKSKAIKKEHEKKAKQKEFNSRVYSEYYNEAQLHRALKKRLLSGEHVEDYDAVCDKLMQHQLAGARIAESKDKFGFFFDTGTGKTVLGLEIIQKKLLEFHERFLIISPKTIINTAWLDDCEQFYPKMKIFPIKSNMKMEDYKELYKRWNRKGALEKQPLRYYFNKKSAQDLENARKYLLGEADHYITNPERFKIDYKKMRSGQYKKKWLMPDYLNDIDGIIIDESAIIKNRDTEIYRLINEYSERLKYIYLMSGKPAPNNLKEYESQISIIAPELYKVWLSNMPVSIESGSSIKVFPNTDFLPIIDLVSLTVSKHDCIDLPETTEVIRKIQLDEESERVYNRVRYTTSQLIKNKETEEVFFIAGNFMKLRECASGFLIENNQNDKDKQNEITIHNLKTNELLNVLEEIGNEQVIIWCQFKYEIRKIEALLKKIGKVVVTAYSGTVNKDQSIKEFKDGTAQYIIAHPATLKYGVTLTNCTYAVYYSISYSFEEYYQSHDRIYRKGQTNPCTYIFLLTENTIDEIMYDSVMKKKSRTEFTEDVLKHLMT